MVGFVAMSANEKAVAGAIPRETITNLSDHVVMLRAGEVVLALEERRNALPLNDQIGRAHVELQSLMRISYAVFCLKKKKLNNQTINSYYATSLQKLNK